MNALVAKAVFDQLTLADILEMSKPDEIQIDTPYERTYKFNYWRIEGNNLHLFWDECSAVPDPEISLPLDGKIVQVEDYFCIAAKEDMNIFFYKLVPFRISDLLSSEKPDPQGM